MYAVDGGGLELAQRFIMCAALVDTGEQLASRGKEKRR